jgi:hypothetical protein
VVRRRAPEGTMTDGIPGDGQGALFKGLGKSSQPRPTEFALHCSLADILRKWVMPGWAYTHLPMGEERPDGAGARLKRMGVTSGWPDFLFVGPSVLFLELKRPGTKNLDAALRQNQNKLRSHIIRSGYRYLLTSDLRDAVAQLQALGIVDERIHVQ